MALNIDHEKYKKYLIKTRKCRESYAEGCRGELDNIISYFRDRDLSQQTVDDFCEWRLSQGNKKSTVNVYIKHLRNIDKMLGLNRLTNYIGFRIDEPHKEVLTAQEADVIVNCDKLTPRGTTEDHHIMTTLIRLLLVTGCRIGEALELRHEDVRPDCVIFQYTKTHKSRQVYISPEMARQMKSLPRYSSYVFARSTGRILPQKVHAEIRRRAHVCGIDKVVGCHTMRHTFVSLMGERDANILKVGAMTGQTPNTIQRYYHSSLHHQKQVSVLNPLEASHVTPHDVIERLKSIISEYSESRVKIEVVENERGLTIEVQKQIYPRGT